MSEPKAAYSPKYVQADRTSSGRLVAKGTLKHGLKFGDQVAQRDFELHEARAGDLMDAELSADLSKALNFSVALLAKQLVKLGTYEGPFTVGLLRDLRGHDLHTLREAQAEFDIVGELP